MFNQILQALISPLTAFHLSPITFSWNLSNFSGFSLKSFCKLVMRRSKKTLKTTSKYNSSRANFSLFLASVCFTTSVTMVFGLAGCSVPPWDLWSQFFATFVACQHFHCISTEVIKDVNSGCLGWQPLKSCEQNQQAESIGWILKVFTCLLSPACVRSSIWLLPAG